MTEPLRRRLFLAVGLEPETRALVAAHLEAQGAAGWADRLVVPDNWHVTLRFLGWADEAQRDRVLHSLDEADLPPPFRIRLGSLGAFPKPRRATVTWIAVESGTDELERLAVVAEETALTAGFAPDDRPFHPHLTVGRVRPPIDVTARIDQFEPCTVVMDVDRITLFESHLRRGGARYEALDEVVLD
jgi:2'-5' RNA ligase